MHRHKNNGHPLRDARRSDAETDFADSDAGTGFADSALLFFFAELVGFLSVSDASIVAMQARILSSSSFVVIEWSKPHRRNFDFSYSRSLKL
jgi:hypothetical protein